MEVERTKLRVASTGELYLKEVLVEKDEEVARLQQGLEGQVKEFEELRASGVLGRPAACGGHCVWGAGCGFVIERGMLVPVSTIALSSSVVPTVLQASHLLQRGVLA